MIIFLPILMILFTIVAGLSEAVMDTLSHHFEESIFKDKNPKWWNPIYSGNNKWKNGDKTQGEKFFLSSTLLVGFSEAWHTFKTIRTFSMWVGIGLSVYLFGFWGLIGSRILFGLAFTLFYKLFKIKKNSKNGKI